MTTPPLPSIDQVRSLPSFHAQDVPEHFIDENGHMNIGHFFMLGAMAPWERLGELGSGGPYIEERGLSFFTVEHHIRYLGELRLGESLSVRPGLAGRTAKALHAISFVVDEGRDRVACSMEVMYVHVSMQTRRAVDIPDDVAAALDAEMAAHPWVADVADGLALRR